MTAAQAAEQNGSAGHGKRSKTEKSKLRKKNAKQHRRELRELLAKKEQEKKQAEGQNANGKADGEESVILEYVEAPLPKEILEADVTMESKPIVASIAEADGDVEMDGAGVGPGSERSVMEDIRRAFFRLTGRDEEEKAGEGAAEAGPVKEEPKDIFGADEGAEDGEEGGEKASKKKAKLAARMRVAELKRTCARPDVVEVWDVTAPDPHLLVHLKAYKNSVPVPRHWSQKRAYLQGKRGIEKPPFKLPDYIEATGITDMRDAYLEKQAQSKQKQVARSRMRPKMGKLQIEYGIMYDAFFKYQTKPKMSRVGDLYYEGKEFEHRPDNLIPGVVSTALRDALGMPNDSAPPPWLRNMQRYGPPPSYPELKIPGLNAPIPPGAMFGYEQGQWGKPPVDMMGRPLYGDVFGNWYQHMNQAEQQVDKSTKWGDFAEVEEEEESSEEEEEEGKDEEGEEPGLREGIRTGVASVASTVPQGLHTPGAVDIRKQAPESAAATPLPAGAPKQLYTVLEERKTALGQGLMGSDHVYVLPGQDKRTAALAKLDAIRGEVGSAGVDVSIDATEIEGLDEEAIRDLYQQRLLEEQMKRGGGDLSDMVAARAAQQARKADAKRKQQETQEEERFKF